MIVIGYLKGETAKVKKRTSLKLNDHPGTLKQCSLEILF